MSTAKIRGGLFIIALLVTLACGLDSTWPGRVGLSGAGPQPTPTPVQYRLGLESARAGLDELDSYRANLIVEFDGRRDGQPAAGQIESLTEVSRRPAALHQYARIDLITPTARLANGVVEYIRLGETVYARRAGQPDWLTLTAGETRPADFGLPALEQFIILPAAVSNPPQFETLQELSVRRYRFDQNDLAGPNIIFEQARGDLWLATHGNFLVQYVISASVRITVPRPQADIIDEGQLTLRYTLTDVNRELIIRPPPAVESGPDALSKLPRLPDARLISVLPTLIEYTSAISSISATLFYRDQLAAGEWSEDQAEIFEEKSRLVYSRENQRLTILITPAGQSHQTKVMLSLDQ